ncbi:MAG: uracil-DNA glycosylase [Elusimicrobiota bacterium]
MRSAIGKELNKYLSLRRDTGETGFWADEKKAAKGSSDRTVSLEGEFSDLERQVKNCRRCRLGEYRLNACFGNGNRSSRIMFVGEGPGFEEDHRGEVFVGRAGKLLDKFIQDKLGLSRSDVFITNIVKCHPMKDPSNPDKRGNDRPPSKDEVESCIGFLVRQVELVKPSLVVTLGSPASKTILKTEQGISRLRGRSYDIMFGGTGIKVVPAYHPAYLLRNASKIGEMAEDFSMIKSML